MKRKAVGTLVLCAALLVPGSSSAADVTIVAAGTSEVNITAAGGGPAKCTTVPTEVSLKSLGATHAFQARFGSGAPTDPAADALCAVLFVINDLQSANAAPQHQCVTVPGPAPVGGTVTVDVNSRLTINGNVYTIEHRTEYCDGDVGLAKAILTVGSNNTVGFSWSVTLNNVLAGSGSGTLTGVREPL